MSRMLVLHESCACPEKVERIVVNVAVCLPLSSVRSMDGAGGAGGGAVRAAGLRSRLVGAAAGEALGFAVLRLAAAHMWHG
jgi:hypothetical protein